MGPINSEVRVGCVSFGSHDNSHGESPKTQEIRAFGVPGSANAPAENPVDEIVSQKCEELCKDIQHSGMSGRYGVMDSCTAVLQKSHTIYSMVRCWLAVSICSAGHDAAGLKCLRE